MSNNNSTAKQTNSTGINEKAYFWNGPIEAPIGGRIEGIYKGVNINGRHVSAREGRNGRMINYWDNCELAEIEREEDSKPLPASEVKHRIFTQLIDSLIDEQVLAKEAMAEAADLVAANDLLINLLIKRLG